MLVETEKASSKFRPHSVQQVGAEKTADELAAEDAMDTMDDGGTENEEQRSISKRANERNFNVI